MGRNQFVLAVTDEQRNELSKRALAKIACWRSIPGSAHSGIVGRADLQPDHGVAEYHGTHDFPLEAAI
jgi:hypothetical protein